MDCRADGVLEVASTQGVPLNIVQEAEDRTGIPYKKEYTTRLEGIISVFKNY
jgi:hypothetical protein